MEIEILDKTVDLTIPTKYSKFTDDTIQELAELGFFDDVDQYYTPEDTTWNNKWSELFIKYDRDDRCEESIYTNGINICIIELIIVV